MALDAALEQLCSELRRFRDILAGLETTVTEDRPETGAVILVDEVSNAITDLDSQSRECLDAAEAALCAVDQPFDPHRLRRSLAGSQLSFHLMARLLVSDLLTYEKIGALVGFGSERGHGWDSWVRAVRLGLEECRAATTGLADAYLACWREIAERLFSGPIALHTTNIGQNISAGALDGKGPVEAGIT